ncbi:hypothetical protein BGZ91_006168 [Linnemannia elongata]|nr:hypothetical protein BGZ91_006168 [Linnemannia elongata]
MFVQKVKEKEIALREREEQLNAKKAELMAELEQARLQLEAEHREVEELVTLSRIWGSSLGIVVASLRKSEMAMQQQTKNKGSGPCRVFQK